METCDDCGIDYPGPAYYTFDLNSCGVYVDVVRLPHDCTGNICPDCAGPFLDPDVEGDPRQPEIDFYDPKMHTNMEVVA